MMIAVLVLLIIALAVIGCSKSENQNELIIFHAGSLSVPFREISNAFHEKYPDVVISAEAAGTRDSARKISELGRRCDVFGAADYVVVRDLLMPEHAGYNIRFATNEMAIAYTEKSRHRQDIDSDNWHIILLRKDVNFGRSDPDRDPCGYRTIMLFQLAEKHYGLPGLAEKLESKHGSRFIRPKETDMLALLEAGEIDYLFIYRSVIEQHGLKMVRLPDEINLSSTEMAEIYGSAQVSVTGKKPGEYITMVGEPIVYSVTIPRSARNPLLAEKWVQFLLSSEGQAIMEEQGQSPIVPARVMGDEKLPASLTRYCIQAGD